MGVLPTAPENPRPTRPLSALRLVVIHWSGDPHPIPEGYDSMQHAVDEAEYHIGLDWSEEAGHQGGYGLMYHEVIDRYGRIFLTRPARDEVWACRGANPISYNVCLDATEGSPPTEAQLRALPRRLEDLLPRYGLGREAVYGHGELVSYGNSTECPGPSLLALVRAYRAGR